MIELLAPRLREEIQEAWAPHNERLEQEWFEEPVPGFRFGSAPRNRAIDPPSSEDMVEYFDRVIALCESARTKASVAAQEEDVDE